MRKRKTHIGNLLSGDFSGLGSFVLDNSVTAGPYSRIGLGQRYGNLQSYWTRVKPWKLTVVLD